MGIVILYFLGIILFVASVLAAVTKKKISSSKIIRYLTIFHFITLILTVLLIVLWSFRIHLPGQILEVIPFWIFIFSGIFIFGFTRIFGLKKVYSGIIFFTHLFFSLIVLIPYLGFGLAFPVYSYFIPDRVIYESSQLRVQDNVRTFMSRNYNPYIYFKCGLFELKRQAHTGPVYQLDSVALKKIDAKHVKLDFYRFKGGSAGTIKSDTITCECF